MSLPISLMIKLSGLRKKCRLHASLMTSTSSFGPLINNVKGKTQPFSRISSKLSVNLVSIVDRFASLNASNNSSPESWCGSLEFSFSQFSSWVRFLTCTAVEVGLNTTAKTLLRTIEHFGALSLTDFPIELIP